MKYFLLILFGFFVGIWLSWPGILLIRNWKCFNEIISKAADKKISLKAILGVSPNYFIKGGNQRLDSKIRIISDTCFR